MVHRPSTAPGGTFYPICLVGSQAFCGGFGLGGGSGGLPCTGSTTEPESTRITGEDHPPGVTFARFRDHCDAERD
jgi:hypothetical protein